VDAKQRASDERSVHRRFDAAFLVLLSGAARGGSFRPYLGCSGDVPKCDHAPRLPMRPEILMPPDIPAAVCTMSSSLVEGVGAENRFLHLCPGVSPREYASEEAVKEHVVIGKG